ncbi:MAG TPA: NAD(P)H-dependent glycerol-3-phosphate dehydrogenase [Ruminiclostridium sp.]|nr:NAD(P)H-dependent glycerol-3-phosphate dehydrogenase [Ruminiclostridium sp.]
MSRITILGSGGWGTALAVMCCKYGHQVTLWSPFDAEVKTIRSDGENKKLLPGVKVPDEINLTTDINLVVGADLIIMAVPSFAVRSTSKRLRELLKGKQVIVNVAKGLEEDSLKRMSQVIGEELPDTDIVALSGPSHAEEVSRDVPTAIVAASDSEEAAERVQEILMNQNFRIYVNTDIIGVELGASLKNVIALAAGVCDGLKLGDNTKAALMTRGITEMARLGVKMGGSAQTLAGLSGIGDLIVTCTSVHSRNRRAGIYIGEGLPVDKAIEKVGMTVEGYKTTHAAYMLSKKAGVEMPIVNECYNVLYEGKNPSKAIRDLMMREKKSEVDDLWPK